MQALLSLLRCARPSRKTAAHRGSRCQPALELLEERAVPSATSIIQSNFNGTPLHAGDTIWFSSVAKVNGLGSAPVTLQVVNQTIDFTANGVNYDVSVPNASITFDPSATTATTTFDTGTQSWVTVLPPKFSGNVFLAGVALPLPNGLPGGVNPVSWTASFVSSTPGLNVNWQWAAAAYTQFSTEYTTLNVKAVDDNHFAPNANSDQAGTPEAFKAFVTGGARGGGGANATGSLSATASAQPDLNTASLAGTVFNASNNNSGLGGVLVTLTGTNALGQKVTLSTKTDTNGNYSFTGLVAGTYSITETLPPGATSSSTTYSGLVLGAGAHGTNYNFVDFFTGISGS
jgi:hypothetical protein